MEAREGLSLTTRGKAIMGTDLLVPLVLLLASMFGGALKSVSLDKRIRVTVKFVSVFAGVLPFLIIYDDVTGMLWVEGARYVIAGSFVLFGATFASLKLVEFGESLGTREEVGVASAVKEVSEQVKAHFAPLLDAFDSRFTSQVSELRGIVKKERAGVLSHLDSRTGELERLVEQLSENHKGLVERYSARAESYNKIAEGYNSSLKACMDSMNAYHQDIESIRSMQEQLAVRIEVYQKLGGLVERREGEVEGRENEPDDRSGSVTSPSGAEHAKLTRADGQASRSIGADAEQELAEYIHNFGFEANVRRAAGDPDIELRSSGRLVGFVNTKSYMLYDEPKRSQRHIGPDDAIPEMVAARRFKVPLVLAVKNRRNGRIWVHVVPYEEFADWKGVSTPLLLVKDDPESGKQLQESVMNVLKDLGAKV